MSNLIGLLDGDILVYRCGFSAEKKIRIPYINGVAHPELSSAAELKEFKQQHEGEDIEIEERRVIQPIEFALGNIKTVLAAIEAVVGANTVLHLSGPGNFRKDLATILPYKGQRSEFDRPVYYKEIREYLLKYQGALLSEEEEADDTIGIQATQVNESYKQPPDQEAVIVTIDKDLDMIEGYHYNWVSGAKYKISKEQGLRCFYRQLLTGDRTDNIPGLKGVGDKTAEKILGDATKEHTLFNIVRDEYHRRYPDGYDEYDKVVATDAALLEIGRLLYIRKREGEIWEFPSR